MAAFSRLYLNNRCFLIIKVKYKMMSRLQKIIGKFDRLLTHGGILLLACQSIAGVALGQSGSVLVNAAREGLAASHSADGEGRPTAELNRRNEPLHSLSLFTIGLPEPTQWRKNDLLQVLIRETSKISSAQELKTQTKYKNNISSKTITLPLDSLQHLLMEELQTGELELRADRKFDGTGEYVRDDDFTARVTARVMEVLPNGHLVIEARTYIETDDEESTLKLSGICDPKNISPAGSILSTDVFDLRIMKENEGELRKANKKGFITKVLEAVFAF